MQAKLTIPLPDKSRSTQEKVPEKACLKISMAQKIAAKERGDISFKRGFNIISLVNHPCHNFSSTISLLCVILRVRKIVMKNGKFAFIFVGGFSFSLWFCALFGGAQTMGT